MQRSIFCLVLFLAATAEAQQLSIELAGRSDYPRQIEMPSGVCVQVGVYVTASDLPSETFTDLTVDLELYFEDPVFVSDPELAITRFAATPAPGFTSPPTLVQDSDCDPAFTYNSRPGDFGPDLAPAQGAVDPTGTTAAASTNRPAPGLAVTQIQLSNPTGLVDTSIGLDRALIAVLTFEIRTTNAAPDLPRQTLMSMISTQSLLSSSNTDVFAGFADLSIHRTGSELLAQTGFEGNNEPQTFSYRSLPFSEVAGNYMIGDEIEGTITFQPPLTANRAYIRFPESHVIDFEFSDGVRTLTPQNSEVVSLLIGTSEAGIPDTYAIGIWELPIPSTMVSGLDLFQIPEASQFSDDVFIDSPCTLTGDPPECNSISPSQGSSYGITAGSGTWTLEP